MNTSQKQKRLRSKADKLFFEVGMKLNEGGRCLLCPKPAGDIHHFKPKGSYGHLRYEIKNGIPLCKGCHFRLTHADSSLQARIASIKGKAWYDEIEELGKNRPTSFVNMKWYQGHIENLQRVLQEIQEEV